MEKIGWRIKEKSVENGVTRVSIALVNSNKTGTVNGTDKGRLGCNELPYILHALKKSGYVAENKPLPDAHYGFPYTFDFEIYDTYPGLI